MANITALNIVSASAGHFYFSFFLSRSKINSPIFGGNSGTYLLMRDDINSLDAGTSNEAKGIKTIEIIGEPAGTYWFGVYIDSDNNILETDEENNVLYDVDQITVTS